VPGYEAPVNLAYSLRNRSAAVPHPGVQRHSPKAQAVIEFRCPDPSCNPYLAFSAVLMAVIDGDPEQASIRASRSTRTSTTSRRRSSPRRANSTPASRSKSRARLHSSEDHDFLLRGDVFTEDVIETWI
jgi:glutamine synthetase